MRAQFSDAVNIELGLRSLRRSRRFAAEIGQEIDLHRVGYLFLLDRREDVDAFERNVALQNELGGTSRMVDVAEAKRLSPLIDTDGLLAAAWSPGDGHCTPESVVLGYAGAAPAARARGWSRGCAVTGIATDGAGHHRVCETSLGTIHDRAWSSAPPELGRSRSAQMVGVDLPVVPLRRQILTTEPMPGLDPRHTVHDRLRHHLLLPRRGPGSAARDVRSRRDSRLQAGPVRRLAARGWARRSQHRAPAIAEVGIAGGWAGLYEMTPDHNALVGEAAEVSRFLYATGFSGPWFPDGTGHR